MGLGAALLHNMIQEHSVLIVMCSVLQLMTHLVNHTSHFPMGLGAARLHTTVQEHNDLAEVDDLKPDLFDQPNVQLFILNHRCLISFIELPAMVNI